MHEACRKPEGLITGHLRHFTVSRVFFSLEGESKTRVTYEMELFVKGESRLEVVSTRQSEVHPRYHKVLNTLQN